MLDDVHIHCLLLLLNGLTGHPMVLPQVTRVFATMSSNGRRMDRPSVWKPIQQGDDSCHMHFSGG